MALADFQPKASSPCLKTIPNPPQPRTETHKDNMQIQINTDNNVPGREALSAHVSDVVESALSHVKEHVTRVEVHLSDENGPKTSSRDMRCAMEARIASLQPVAVTHEAATLNQAIDGAAEKLARLIGNTLGRLRHEGRHQTDPVPPEPGPLRPKPTSEP